MIKGDVILHVAFCIFSCLSGILPLKIGRGSMSKNKKMGVRYFLLSFLITFSVVTLIALAVLSNLLNPAPAHNITDNVPKFEHNYTDSDSITVLCIGYSRKQPQTAYYSLLKLDAPNKRVLVTSIPADTKIGEKTLTETASYSGSAAATEALAKALDIKIDRYLRIEETSFSSIVDTLGAVTIDLENAVEHYDENGFLDYSMNKGRHVFFGERLCGLIRYSGKDETERANAQSAILASLFSQRLESGKYDDPQKIFETVINSSESNINVFDFENRRAAIEQITKDKDISFVTISFAANEDKTPSEEYLKSMSAYK